MPLLRALAFLSLMPLGKSAHFDSRHVPGMRSAFPYAGAVLGALLGLFWHGTLQIFDANVSAALTVAGWAVLTRFFHLDGVADCSDGLWGGYISQRRLEIMKDPHIGTFGVVAVALVLLLKFTLLGALAAWSFDDAQTTLLWRVAGGALVLGAGRWSVFLIVLYAVYARAKGGLGREFVDAGSSKRVFLIGFSGGSLLMLLAAGAGFLPALVVLSAVFLAGLAVRLIFARALSGVTGDVMGAAIEWSEVVALLALAGCMKFRAV
jgi:adenosylcobinamide-GDP ribazoletransferase